MWPFTRFGNILLQSFLLIGTQEDLGEVRGIPFTLRYCTDQFLL